jgi:hypothetical protein
MKTQASEAKGPPAGESTRQTSKNAEKMSRSQSLNQISLGKGWPIRTERGKCYQPYHKPKDRAGAGGGVKGTKPEIRQGIQIPGTK